MIHPAAGFQVIASRFLFGEPEFPGCSVVLLDHVPVTHAGNRHSQMRTGMRPRKDNQLAAEMRHVPGCAASVLCGHPGFPVISHGAVALDAEAWREIRCGLRLSTRELQIIQGIFDDKLEYSLAVELGISVNTVRTHFRRLRLKLKAGDRVTVVLRVLEEFLRQTASDQTRLPAICRNHAGGRCPFQRGAAPIGR